MCSPLDHHGTAWKWSPVDPEHSKVLPPDPSPAVPWWSRGEHLCSQADERLRSEVLCLPLERERQQDNQADPHCMTGHQYEEDLSYCINLGLVVQREDNAIHGMNHYPVDKCCKRSYAIHWIVIYAADSVIQSLKNWDQAFTVETYTSGKTVQSNSKFISQINILNVVVRCTECIE